MRSGRRSTSSLFPVAPSRRTPCSSPASTSAGSCSPATRPHMVSPQGGFGMNSGIGDAADLGWKLAALIQGWGGPALIPSYSIDRREAVRFIQLGSEANHALGAIELVRDGLEAEGPRARRSSRTSSSASWCSPSGWAASSATATRPRR
ncbi:FAD-dependent monooxygenase [Virgisporangium aliadipatigenens]|uniref:FAD-dependent monooxygenase n=1 Tax=Virgisporangium aliadipatigenens TaxID=741659 RepID=UPI0019413F88